MVKAICYPGSLSAIVPVENGMLQLVDAGLVYWTLPATTGKTIVALGSRSWGANRASPALPSQRSPSVAISAGSQWASKAERTSNVSRVEVSTVCIERLVSGGPWIL
jgi:hypothetical protein